jgi:hypothetical protein
MPRPICCRVLAGYYIAADEDPICRIIPVSRPAAKMAMTIRNSPALGGAFEIGK